MDKRFDRLYILKSKNGELKRVQELCKDYRINDNDIFSYAKKFHIAWGFEPEGLVYLSPTTFLIHKPDFYSIEELEIYLDKFEEKN